MGIAWGMGHVDSMGHGNGDRMGHGEWGKRVVSRALAWDSVGWTILCVIVIDFRST